MREKTRGSSCFFSHFAFSLPDVALCSASKVATLCKFAGRCAQGVLDPLMIPGPRAVLVPYSLSSASLGPLDPKVCSSPATRPLPARLPLWVATFFYCSRSGKTGFGRARTDQGPQHTHYIRHLVASWSHFSPHALFFHIFLKKCFLPRQEAHFCRSTHRFVN